MIVWWCFCGGGLWWCGGVFVVVWRCFYGGVVVFLWWCFCGGVFVVVFLWFVVRSSTGVVLCSTE